MTKGRGGARRFLRAFDLPADGSKCLLCMSPSAAVEPRGGAMGRGNEGKGKVTPDVVAVQPEARHRFGLADAGSNGSVKNNGMKRVCR